MILVVENHLLRSFFQKKTCALRYGDNIVLKVVFAFAMPSIAGIFADCASVFLKRSKRRSVLPLIALYLPL